jgi:hypothetical protein
MREWGVAGRSVFGDLTEVVFKFFKTSIGSRARWGHRFAAVLAASMLVAGCAEFTHRGGILAQIADKAIFPASAKGHRVLRSYVVMAALVTVANNRGVPSGDKLALRGRVIQTLESIQDAFICAYATQSGCIFFDQKMAKVDYNLYKLALNVLITSETKALITQLQGELLPKIPVVGSTLLAASSAAETAGHVVTAGVETVQIAESLIKLGYDAGSTIAPLFPIYRDAQELDMVVVVDMLARRCAAQASLTVKKDQNAFRDNLILVLDPKSLPDVAECHSFIAGMNTYKLGNGYLEDWRSFTADMSKLYLADMTPSSDHFVEISSMITLACEQIASAEGSTKGAQKGGSTACSTQVLFPDPPLKNPSVPLKTAQESAYALANHGTAPAQTASVVGSNPVKNSKGAINFMPPN